MSDNGLLRMERRAAGAHRPRRAPDRKRAYLVGVTSVLGLAVVFVGTGVTLRAFDDGVRGWVACLGPLFGLPCFWSGVIRLVDPTIPVRFTERTRSRVHVGGVEQIHETRGPEQTVEVKRGYSPTMMAIGLVAYAIGIGLLVAGSAPVAPVAPVGPMPAER